MNDFKHPARPVRANAQSPDLTVDNGRRRLVQWSLLSAGAFPFLSACTDPPLVEEPSSTPSESGGASAQPPAPAPGPGSAPSPSPAPSPAPGPAPAPAPPAPPTTTLSSDPPPIGAAPPVVAPAASNLPSWAPPAGQVALLTQANGRLTNTHNSTCAPYYEPFYYAKVVNDYSTYVVNPHFGEYGALIGFGGGHAAVNDNTVWGLVLGRDDCTFRRLIDPSPLFGTGTDADTRAKNSTANVAALRDPRYAEYLIDGKPAAPHSYASGDIIGPADGGAACGTFIRVLTAAVGAVGDLDVGACHQVAMNDSAGPYQWQRRTNNSLPYTIAVAPMQWTAHVPAQRRVYFETRAGTSTQPPRWFDLASNSYVSGSGSPRRNDGAGSDTGIMFHVPERGLIVFADAGPDGVLRLQYMNVTTAQPAWAGVVLSHRLPVPQDFSCATWCPDNRRIVVGGATGDESAVYEVEIPVDPSSPWNIVRAPFSGGQTIKFVGSPTYKKWSYNPRVRAIVYMPTAGGPGGSDTIWVYRPRST